MIFINTSSLQKSDIFKALIFCYERAKQTGTMTGSIFKFENQTNKVPCYWSVFFIHFSVHENWILPSNYSVNVKHVESNGRKRRVHEVMWGPS